MENRPPRLDQQARVAAAEALRRRGAPRTKLRIRAANDQPTAKPILVCETCAAWTPHEEVRAPVTMPGASNGGTVESLWQCACGARRSWGRRSL